MTLDAIWAATFGTTVGTTESQIKYLSSEGSLPLPQDVDGEAKFPQAATPAAFDSIITLTDTFEVSAQLIGCGIIS